ncbi:uncharacterized protein B4U80_12397, partial [Leptotrombidium deliense]
SPMRPVVTEIDAHSTRDTELIYANLKVETMKMRCLIDTGSMVSIVRKDVADTFRKELKPYKGGAVISATGNKFNILGEVELSIYLNDYFNDRIVVYALVVENFSFEVLLGNDFNRIAGVSIDCANRSVSFRNIGCYSQAAKPYENNFSSDEEIANETRKRCGVRNETRISKLNKGKSSKLQKGTCRKTAKNDFTEST